MYLPQIKRLGNINVLALVNNQEITVYIIWTHQNDSMCLFAVLLLCPKFQNFASDKMEWPKHYTSEKVLTLMTYTELVNKRHGRDTQSQIEPIRCV